jgi:CCR4-NOT transcription complex subunit 1
MVFDLIQQYPGQPFWDPNVPHAPFANALPDPLRIRPLGVQPLQAAVYEDFGRLLIPHMIVILVDSSTGPEHKARAQLTSRPGSTASYSRGDAFSAMYNPSPGPDNVQARGMLDHQEAVDQFNVCRQCLRFSVKSLTQPPEHGQRA